MDLGVLSALPDTWKGEGERQMTTLNTGSARHRLCKNLHNEWIQCGKYQGLNGHKEKENPFAEYMWMENEEDFNRQMEEALQEQDFLDGCF